MTKKGFKINFFDIIIVLVIICLGGGAYYFLNKKEVVQTKKLVYSVELTDCEPGFSKNIKEGDIVYDNVKNYKMGTVVKAEAVPFTKIVEDIENKRFADAVIPDRETVIVTIEADVTENDSEFKVEGSYIVKTGKEVFLKGPGYAGLGWTLTIER